MSRTHSQRVVGPQKSASSTFRDLRSNCRARLPSCSVVLCPRELWDICLEALDRHFSEGQQRGHCHPGHPIFVRGFFIYSSASKPFSRLERVSEPNQVHPTEYCSYWLCKWDRCLPKRWWCHRYVASVPPDPALPCSSLGSTRELPWVDQ